MTTTPTTPATVDPIMTALHDLLWIAHDHLTMADHTRFRAAFAEIEKDRRAIDRRGGVVTAALLRWQHGIAGNSDIVTYNGEDVIGIGWVQNYYRAKEIIDAHNKAIDALEAALGQAHGGERG